VFDRCSSAGETQCANVDDFFCLTKFSRSNSTPRIRCGVFATSFHLPLGKDGKLLIYLPAIRRADAKKRPRQIVDQELDDWARLGVDAHLDAKTPWYTYQEPLREPTARMVGANRSKDLHEQPDGEFALDDGDLLSPTKSRF